MQNKLKDLNCPRCGQETLRPVAVHNALCRIDNETWICSGCGTDEAFVDFGLSEPKIWSNRKAWRKALDTLTKKLEEGTL